MELFNFFCQI